MNKHYEASNFDELETPKRDERAPAYTGILVNDLPDKVLDTPHICGIDTETTPFDPKLAISIYRQARPVLFQYYSQEFGPYLIRLGDELPENVFWLLGSAEHTKVIHHAMFDMGMLYSRYPVVNVGGKKRDLGFSAVACTKVAAKLVDPDRKMGAQKLTALADRYLGINIDKGEQLSDWTSAELTEAQIDYAIRDVQYLPTLYERMQAEINDKGLTEQYATANRFLFLQMVVNLNTDPRVYTY
jgi:ribonuclease D